MQNQATAIIDKIFENNNNDFANFKGCMNQNKNLAHEFEVQYKNKNIVQLAGGEVIKLLISKNLIVSDILLNNYLFLFEQIFNNAKLLNKGDFKITYIQCEFNDLEFGVEARIAIIKTPDIIDKFVCSVSQNKKEVFLLNFYI